MVILKCHGCGREAKTDRPPKEFVCKVCGAVNVVPDTDTASEACGCLPPRGFEWTLPAGVKERPDGKIFITAQGTEMSKAEYIEAFGIDPEVAKAWMEKMGHEGKPGFKNLSTLGRKQ
jgi:hypothetical protein